MIRHAPYEVGPADFAIGLAPIEEADWLEGGEADPAARKDRLFATRRRLVFGELDGSRPGQEEALALVEKALPSGAPREGGWPPLYAAARRVADDLCLMERRQRRWTLTALSLSAGSLFTAEEALGKDLGALHGPVPGFEGRLLPRTERIFEGLREGLILQRRNWSVVNDADPHLPDPAPMRARIGAIDARDAGRELFVRAERQTLRRLPRTGGALFTIRVWIHPLEDLRGEPERLAAFARAWREASPDFRAYKQLHLYDALVEAFLAG